MPTGNQYWFQVNLVSGSVNHVLGVFEDQARKSATVLQLRRRISAATDLFISPPDSARFPESWQTIRTEIALPNC